MSGRYIIRTLYKCNTDSNGSGGPNVCAKSNGTEPRLKLVGYIRQMRTTSVRELLTNSVISDAQ